MVVGLHVYRHFSFSQKVKKKLTMNIHFSVKFKLVIYVKIHWPVSPVVEFLKSGINKNRLYFTQLPTSPQLTDMHQIWCRGMGRNFFGNRLRDVDSVGVKNDLLFILVHRKRHL